MKNEASLAGAIAMAAVIWLALIPPAAAQWTFTTNNGAITITEYSGTCAWPAIPATTNGYPVVAIGSLAFAGNNTITNVTIPDSVTNIGDYAFENSALVGICIPASVSGMGEEVFAACWDLACISVDAANPSYSSMGGVLFDGAQDLLIQYPPALANTSYTVPASVTTIADDAFYDVANLDSVTLPTSVSSMGDDAFAFCNNLNTIYFEGNAPGAGSFTFYGTGNGSGASVYYLPGTTGWPGFSAAESGSLAGVSFWYLPGPEILYFEPSFGLQGGQFKFTISWATNATLVVDACTNLANPAWQSISTNAVTMATGTNDFGDPHWTNYWKRFYRVRLPQPTGGH